MFESNHVSVPMIISGSVDSIHVSRSLPFFLRLWKLMFRILYCFFGTVFVFFFIGLGDDVMIGISVLKVEQLNDGEFMLDPDVDGMDASDILSAISGLVDMFSVECLQLSPFGIKCI